MRVLILGGDGYLGWPTAMRFSGQGHEVGVVDNFARRRWVEEAGSSVDREPMRRLLIAHGARRSKVPARPPIHTRRE